MRSKAGIVAGLLLAALVANCGGDDTKTTSTPKGGSANAGEGGEAPSSAGQSSGGTSSAGKPSAGGGGEGGAVVATGCTKDADCDSNAACIGDVCLLNDGEACSSSSDCQSACIDEVCTDKLADGEDCVADQDCAHTCIDSICAPPSDVGGDCDVALGAGGAGGAGAGGMSSVGGADAGGAPGEPQAVDCAAPLVCFAGKCLTPDGEACKDNIDCVNTCVDSVCQPRQGLDGACDDKSDCISDAFVCDAATSTCKLQLKEQCNDNGQCQSNRCLCANDTCTVRTCKTATSVCQCRWSPVDSASCDNNSAAIKIKSTDPNGCDGDKICNGAGLCITNAAGDCSQKCQVAKVGDDGVSGTSDDTCTSFGTATGCNSGYVGKIAPNGDCAAVKTGATVEDGKGNTLAVATCQATCSCELP